VFTVLRDLAGGGTGDSYGGVADLYHPLARSAPSRITVTCASAGNHGMAVARGADMFGCNAVVFLPAATPSYRIQAIQAHGARVEVVDGAYDEAVAMAAGEAERNGWIVVADTSLRDDDETSIRIMEGYGVLAREILGQLEDDLAPTHVFLQAGVGGLAAAVSGYLWDRLGTGRPRFVAVEPASADGLLESALMGHPCASSGNLETSMDCLACREVSRPAWTILKDAIDAFLTIADSAAEEMVQVLSRGMGGDRPIHTQPSGAAGLAGLVAASFEPGLAAPLRLGKRSRVVVIGTEGPAWRAEDGRLGSRRPHQNQQSGKEILHE
jgi:diaminopropionate ammonia-lyase